VIVLILLLLLVLLLLGVGFTMHVLWIAAAVLLIFCILGFSRHHRNGGGRRYAWNRR
jgi:hypothetical protein